MRSENVHPVRFVLAQIIGGAYDTTFLAFSVRVLSFNVDLLPGMDEMEGGGKLVGEEAVTQAGKEEKLDGFHGGVLVHGLVLDVDRCRQRQFGPVTRDPVTNGVVQVDGIGGKRHDFLGFL